MRRIDLYVSSRWLRLSDSIRFGRALGYCEMCGMPHGAIAADGRTLIFLGCAHLNGDPSDLRPENLRALCSQCHFLYDQFRRVRAFVRAHPELKAVFTGGRRRTGRRGHGGRQTGRRGDGGKKGNGRTAGAGCGVRSARRRKGGAG